MIINLEKLIRVEEALNKKNLMDYQKKLPGKAIEGQCKVKRGSDSGIGKRFICLNKESVMPK